MPEHLQKAIEVLKRQVLSLCALVEEDVRRAVKAVSRRDENLAQQVMKTDYEIDHCEVDIEEECLKILALHQPVAIDLRYVIAIMKINNDLERIGDLAVNIAEQAIYLSKTETLAIPFDFETMVSKTQTMLSNSLNAMIQMEVKTAWEVCAMDDEVDAINRQMYQQVQEGIKKQPERVETFIRFLSVSRQLERIADYATNIAEDVIYMIEGKIVRHRPDIAEEFFQKHNTGKEKE